MKLYKRISLLLSMGIMGIGLISYRFAPVAGSGIETDLTPTPAAVISVTPAPTAAPSPTPSPTPIPNDAVTGQNPEIDELIEKYLNAKLSCDIDDFKDIVTDTSYIDTEALQARTSTILSYDDITCYVKRGAEDIDYVVYYTYLMDIATIETRAISIDMVYVTVDDAGTYRIFTGSMEDGLKAELDKLSEDEDIVNIVSYVYSTMDEQIASDAGLYEFWMRIYEGEEYDSGYEGETGELPEDAPISEDGSEG